MPDRSWFTIRAAADGKRASLYLYDEIGYFGITAAAFVQELRALDVDAIDMFVNSPGGDVYDAYAIYNALKRHRAEVNATVDGLAASAASVIVQAANPGKLIMLKPSTMMIHDPWMVTVGDVAAHEKSIEQLNGVVGDIADVYTARAGGERDEWREAMAAETWYTADEAVAAGLADSVAEAAPNNVTTGRIYNLSKFRNVPAYVPRDENPPVRGGEPIKIAASIKHARIEAYLGHHDEAGAVDPARVALALERAHNLAIPVDDRAGVINHLKAHREA